MTPPARIRLRLLGRLALAVDDEAGIPVRLATRKAGAALAYLAMSPEQAASREELATLLWGSCSDQQARQNLRQALASLRKDLRWSHFLVADANTVRLQPGMWSVDAVEFEQLARSSSAADLERAARLFAGEFLSGLDLDEEGFDEWLRRQRQRIQLAAARLCETFAARPDLVGDGAQAVAAVERLLALDPLREDRHRCALTLYVRYCGRNEALAQAEGFAGVLRRELDVDPEAETRSLVEDIRRGAIGPVTPLAPAMTPAAAGPPEVSPTAVERGAADEKFRQSDSAPISHAAARRWSALRQLPNRGMVGVGFAALLLGVAVSFLAHNRFASTPSVRPSNDAPASLAAAPVDSWKSPPPPLQPDAGGAGSGRRILTPIIVLPFTTYGEAAGSIQSIADMLTDELTNALSRVGSLRVISRQTARTYQGKPVDVAAIGAELGVRFVLEGSMRTHDGKLRVGVELVDTRNRLAIWSGRIERDNADRHSVQDEIVGRLARELQFEAAQAEGVKAASDPDVDDLVFKGFLALQRNNSPMRGALQEAQAYFAQALEREPSNTRARLGLAGYHASSQFDAVDPALHLDKAEELLREVIRQVPHDSFAHYYMGLVHKGRANRKEALEWFERAVASNPSNPLAHAQLALLLARIGRADQGLEYIRYAIRLSPRDPVLPVWLRMTGEIELELGHNDAAIEFFHKSLALHPAHPYALAGLAAAHAFAGRTAEARIYVAELKKAAPQQSEERLLARFQGYKELSEPKLVEGLRLAFNFSS